jgi:hypothetical protein
MPVNTELTINNNNYFFISLNSFQQHPKIRYPIRNYINSIINDLENSIINDLENSIVCIGGESYLFGLANKYKYIIHYTNSKYIYDDANFNNSFYKKKLENYHINYNSFSYIKNGNYLIINLAKLHINLLNQINKRYYRYIIIINCHHNDFWKKIKLLSNFKLINRKKFIVSNYFVTVTLFKYKYEIPTYISLGNTCAIAYQLKQVGLRNISCPFDWCKINLHQLNKVLDNDFNQFHKLDIIKYSKYHKLLDSDCGSYLCKNKYNITFAHELCKNNNYNLNNLEQQIVNRIKNFKASNNINFIIHNARFDIIEVNKLILNLNKYFSKYQIFYITNYTKGITNYTKDNIKLILINYDIINWDNWKLDEINWFDILFN